MLNQIIGRSVIGQPVPEVGLGATKFLFTDRHAGTIIEVRGKTLIWQRDNAERTDSNGMSDAQDYQYSPNPEGEQIIFTLRKNGVWVEKGHPMKNGTRLSIGKRMEYYDFSY